MSKLVDYGLIYIDKHNHNLNLFVCSCSSNEQTIFIARRDHVRRGATTSCGCYIKGQNKTLNHWRHGVKSPTYISWESMKARCSNPNRPNYSRYGGRGITVCARWKEFISFLKDMGKRPKGKTLDRINPEQHYELANCRWATPVQQANNRR